MSFFLLGSLLYHYFIAPDKLKSYFRIWGFPDFIYFDIDIWSIVIYSGVTGNRDKSLTEKYIVVKRYLFSS